MAKTVRIRFEPLAGQAPVITTPYELDVRLGADVVKVKGHFVGKSDVAYTTHELAVVPDGAEVTLVTPDVRLALLVEE